MTTVWINEIHYENIGFDIWEGAEIAGPAGTNLDKWQFVIYTSSGDVRSTITLRGLIPSIQSGFGVLFFFFSLPNDSKGNGLALINPHGETVQFLGWRGKVVAQEGPSKGKETLLIERQETIYTQIGSSLQLTGTGNKYEDFKWVGPLYQTFGKLNWGQKFIPAPKPSVPAPTPAPSPSPPPASEPYINPQSFESVDLLVEKNRAAHHTDKLHGKELYAVRRGQSFEIAVVAKEVATQAIIKLQVYPETGTVVTINVQTFVPQADPNKDWYGYFSSRNGETNYITVFIPGRAITGQYTLTVSGDDGKTWSPPEVVYVLFNAWSKYDDVYLDNENERNEYVLGDDGYIWVGSYYSNSPRPWTFAPFNTKSLQAALQLLQRIPLEERADVVRVARHFSALVNSNDDQGVLVGNWSSNYSGGTSPTAWTGSTDILKEYLLKKAPVKFGQCWVYSGVLTTVARAVGIPTRSVTNFASAHDVPIPDYNRTVDKYFKQDGTEDDDRNADSVWNFHVWNDAWFARRDLGKDQYTGWQAIDATPQERSEKKFQLGPVPVVAVKHGERGIKYDLEFVYSEVNADEKYYVDDGKGNYKLVRTITDSIGKFISTKAVGSSARNDVTLEYKFKENTPEERASHGSADRDGAILFTLDVDAKTKLGDTIHSRFNIDAKNGGGTVNIQYNASIVTYTGKPVKILKSEKSSVNVKQGTSATVAFDLKQSDYATSLQGTNGILFRVYAWVAETDQATILQREFDFVADDLEVSIAEKHLVVGSEVEATVKFFNPLSIKLTNLVLTVEGNDLTKPQHFKFPSVEQHGTITQQVPLKLWAKGKKLLIANLDSTEINDLTGHLEVIVN